MKTFTFLLIFSCFSFAQDVEFSDYGAVSYPTFNRILKKDFNFLIFSNFTPKSGAAISYKDAEAKLQLSGNIYNQNSSIFNLSVETTASEGIYFFDGDRGSSATFNLNYFKFLKPNYKYVVKSPARRIAVRTDIVDLFEPLKHDLEEINEIAKFIKNSKNKKGVTSIYQIVEIDIVEDLIFRSDSLLNTLKNLCRTYINLQDHLAYFYLNTNPIDYTKYDLNSKVEQVRSLDVSKIAQALEKNRVLLNKLEDSVQTLEINYAKSAWTVKRKLFYSAHAFYGRESFLEYDQNGMEAFSNRFDTQRGDLYGAVIYPFNFFYENISGKWGYMPVGKIIFRSYVGGRRLSNRASFKNTEISGQADLGTDTAGNVITGTITRNAYLGDTAYEYGNGVNFGAELYYYPTKYDIGLFSRIGHEFQTYASGTGINNKELTPFRMGFLFGINNDAKTSYTVQLFIDRTDFSLAPNGKDDDLRVGFGLGIPVNF